MADENTQSAGRPTLFTEELAHEICDRIALGRSLRSVCSDDDMPARRTVLYWERAKPEFCASIARAREESQESSIDQCREIAFSASSEDWLVAQLQIKTLQWEAGKRAPKKFGDKVAHEHSGEVKTNVVVNI